MKGITLRFALLFFVTCIMSCVGCGRQDEITVYSIAVSQGPGDIQPAAAAQAPGGTSIAIPNRMLAAIVPQAKQTWFFKMTGPAAEVAKQQESFLALLKSVQFHSETGQPTWELPAGWRQDSATGMRFATIQVDAGERTLELTVIPLETTGDLDEYVLGNVNRWRAQLGLAPVAAIKPDDIGDPSGSLFQFNLGDATVVTLVNLVGQGAGSDAAAPAFDMANHPPVDGLQTSRTANGVADE